MAEPITAGALAALYPAIKWREPVTIKVGETAALGCRICIAQRGFKGKDVKNLPKTVEEFEQHMKAEHPAS